MNKHELDNILKMAYDTLRGYHNIYDKLNVTTALLWCKLADEKNLYNLCNATTADELTDVFKTINLNILHQCNNDEMAPTIEAPSTNPELAIEFYKKYFESLEDWYVDYLTHLAAGDPYAEVVSELTCLIEGHSPLEILVALKEHVKEKNEA